MATILAQVGWRTAVLAGGYKTYRRQVQRAALRRARRRCGWCCSTGRTGSGKTEILARLAARGVQTLDLEGLAEHRGSVFGGLVGRPQPSQKMFESRLLAALDGPRPGAPDRGRGRGQQGRRAHGAAGAVEGDGRRAAHRASRAPAAARARLSGARTTPTSSPTAPAFEASLARLPILPGRKTLAAWRALADAGDLDALAAEPDREPTTIRPTTAPAARMSRPRLGEIGLADLDDAAQEAAARRDRPPR